MLSHADDITTGASVDGDRGHEASSCASNSPTPFHVFGVAPGLLSLLPVALSREGLVHAREAHSGVSASLGTCECSKKLLRIERQKSGQLCESGQLRNVDGPQAGCSAAQKNTTGVLSGLRASAT